MGKTKDIISNGDGTCVLTFKDDATGTDGKFDPGANAIGLSINGLGRASMLLSRFYFDLLFSKGIPNHYLMSNETSGTMLVKELKMIKLEFVGRYLSWGSFCRTYGVRQGIKFKKCLVEMMLKDDNLKDPRICEEAAIALDLIDHDTFVECSRLTREIGDILRESLKTFGFTLVDYKLEFGVDQLGKITLGDEISGGIWRLLYPNKMEVGPIAAAKRICPDYYLGAKDETDFS